MINGFRIRQVRELRGLTQAELARSIGVTQTVIAYYESGRSEPKEEILNLIALKTGFPPAFFKQSSIVNFPLGSLLFRSRASTTKTEKLEAHRYAEVLYEMAEKLVQRIDWRNPIIPRIADDPSQAANIARSEMGLSPDTPIENLVNIIEKVGVLVLAIPAPLEGRDAFSGWSGSAIPQPVIIIIEQDSGERQRFSIAHELGHLVMHHGLIVNQVNL